MSKPTFRVSPSRRPVVQRLTPVAWVLIGVVVLALGLLAVTAVMVLEHRLDDGPWQPTPTVGPTATATPLLPTATPTEWWEGLVDPTADPTPPYPAWWSSQMTQDAEGNWWPPDEVIEMVRTHFRGYEEAYYSFFPEGGTPDLNAMEADLRNWYSGPQLQNQLTWLADVRSGVEGAYLACAQWETCLLQVQDFNADGLECTLGWVCQNGTASYYDADGQLVETSIIPHSPLVLWRMHYDSSNGHWSRYDILAVLEPPGDPDVEP